MKKIWFLSLVVVYAATVFAQSQNAAYLAYIEQWKDVAIQNQAYYGVPASITMAQALLESSAGKSELAQNANNHFGIKCTSEWMGGVYYHDDDHKGECFRQYGDAAESFNDHSLFLQRPRYATCFEIVVEDYEGWAYRLRECGYATDINYAQKLIRIIETYRLDTLGKNAPVGSYDPKSATPVAAATGTRPTQERTVVSEKTEQKAAVVRGSDAIKVIERDPEPEYTPPLSAREEKEHFFIMHPKKKCNGVTYVEARDGDNYSNVAFRLNVRERDLRIQNDALGRELKKGDRIYLSAKKQYAPQEKAIMWVHPGETLWDICQREGIKMETVQKLNGLDPAIRVFHTRHKIYLRKVKEENGQR